MSVLFAQRPKLSLPTRRAWRFALSGLLALGLGLGSIQSALASGDEDNQPMRTLDDTSSFERLAADHEADKDTDVSWATLAGDRADDEAERDDGHEDWQADERTNNEVHPDWHEVRHHEDHDHEHTPPVPEADSYALLLLGLFGLLGWQAFRRCA